MAETVRQLYDRPCFKKALEGTTITLEEFNTLYSDRYEVTVRLFTRAKFLLEDAEDLAQEVFITFLAKAKHFKEPEGCKPKDRQKLLYNFWYMACLYVFSKIKASPQSGSFVDTRMRPEIEMTPESMQEIIDISYDITYSSGQINVRDSPTIVSDLSFVVTDDEKMISSELDSLRIIRDMYKIDRTVGRMAELALLESTRAAVEDSLALEENVSTRTIRRRIAKILRDTKMMELVRSRIQLG